MEEVKEPMRLTINLDDLISRLKVMRSELTTANSGAEIDRRAGIKDRSLRERWYDALETEDCVKVKTLLDEDGELVYEGWKPDVQSSVQRIGTENITPSKLKGCTALHVAARRGDVKLVRRILEMIGRMPRELKDYFLKVKHPGYELDALAMAVINGNMDIVKLLNLTTAPMGYTLDSSVGDTNPFKREELVLQPISKEVLDEISRMEQVKLLFHEFISSEVKEDRRTERGQDLDRGGGSAGSENKEDFDHDLRDRRFNRWFREKIGYDEDCDFNFLDFHLYLFHFTFTGHFDLKGGYSSFDCRDVRRIQKRIIAKAHEDELLHYYLVCKLKDGQGRTPLHIAVDCLHQSGDLISDFLKDIPPPGVHKDRDEEFVNARDSAGRTPLHRAAGLEIHRSLECLLKDSRTNVNATVTYEHDQWGDGLDINKLSLNNNFKSGALWPRSDDGTNKPTSLGALHLAIIHKHVSNVRTLLRSHRIQLFDCERTLDPNRPEGYDERAPMVLFPRSCASALHLAVLVDDPEIVEALLKLSAGRRNLIADMAEYHFPSFFVAAAMGSPSMVKVFLDSNEDRFDPSIRDDFGRTALHSAMERKPIFHPHLLDFVSCKHALSWRRKNYHKIPQDGRDLIKQEEIKEQYGHRKGCIVSLLQAGLSIWTTDFGGRAASPGPDAPEDFVTWWYEKVVQETEKVQQNLNAAANAISVTAALVATTSYVGPLQPPLSYGGDPPGVQVQIASVRVFIICDTMSFYLALAAIVLALQPNLLTLFQGLSIFKLLNKTILLVALAMTCLFPSIICRKFHCSSP